ncbi:MAG: cupredoxin domain-containing protein [Gammaproteobacteria bacterium HGW-Gammaproteobacteria-3]|nr:MAG: cupredoxin domain-containing protein [Gammaproteobacteria bacterium HGW-Gammaproteobacteria-3]
MNLIIKSLPDDLLKKAFRTALVGVSLALLLLITATVNAETQVMELEIKNHLFNPAELVIPANTKIKLLIYNRDPSPEEFESYELNREKIIIGNSKGFIFIGPLAPGEYPFFGEFHIQTALGKVIVR